MWSASAKIVREKTGDKRRERERGAETEIKGERERETERRRRKEARRERKREQRNEEERYIAREGEISPTSPLTPPEHTSPNLGVTP